MQTSLSLSGFNISYSEIYKYNSPPSYIFGSKSKRKIKISLSSILTLFFLSLSTQSLSEKCNSKDKKVLLQIQESFDNSYTIISWKNDTDCCTDWYCVECDPITNRIISLNINQANISGQIPNAVGDLPFLQTLVLRKFTNLTGEIPSTLTKLTHLKEIRLSWTNLSGPVPSFLSQLKNLTILDLSFNDLSGSIPPSLSQLQNLHDLRLDRNKFTGTISDSFGEFTENVPALFLSHNQLTGTVPKSLGYLNFTYIDISRNQLVGDLSFLFGANKSLGSLYFLRNMIEFDLSNVIFPASMENLDFNHNKVFGNLPPEMTGLEHLGYFNFSYNRLCGPIPQGGRLQEAPPFEYFYNRCLCGAPLSACK